ncbi:hypothetical protein [Bacillus bingmayongensis]|uniref:hypothetical protein n=1 Tax=Bacillus bingmayongensis TaxID=1150157 RepID=UPI001C8F0C73|nr:hypothetical protein [Bacillus bingmayongensis]MBY0598757.1 hypothetical protein [Bacillus bingmayongensis]
MGFNWIQLMFWPFMIASIISSLIGIYFKKSYFLIISTVLMVPTSLYLAALPRFFIWPLIFPLLYLCAAIALRKKKIWLSILFSIPVYLLISWLGYIVLNQESISTETII